MTHYVRFHPDLWTTNFNFEAIGVVTTLSDTAMNVTGHFRTIADYVTVSFTSEDFWNHNYVKYETNYDYSDVSFSFTPSYVGEVAHFNDTEIQPAIVVTYKDDSKKYVTLGFNGIKNEGSDQFSFDGRIQLSKSWIDVDSETMTWSFSKVVDDEVITYTGTGVRGEDYDMDYVRGIFYVADSSIPAGARVTLKYQYNTHDKYTLNFNDLYEGTHPNHYEHLSSENIKVISIPFVPTYFKSGELIMTGSSDTFSVTFNDMSVTNGILNEKPQPMGKIPYRVAEGFDDEYNKNPKRLVESMAMLGYEKIINFYIGASHYYDKYGAAGEICNGVGDMYLDPSKGINESFKTWLKSYLHHMSLNGFEDIVISVAMENLQMPEAWKQRLWNGEPAATGWNPPTNFFSPNTEEVKSYIYKITTEILDLVVNAGFKPILQLGESWYWWQEFQPGDVNTPYDGQPPALYDVDTVNRFVNDMGYDLPIYKTSHVEMTDRNIEVAKKIRQYLGEYTVFMKSIANEYDNSKFTILFFPPSVLDEERTPEFMRIVNAPFEYWERPNLDFIQIEDYDWVVHGNQYHRDAFTQAWFDMGYSFAQQHYFAGFAWEEFNVPLDLQWDRIERAAQEALGRGFLEIFIWAGTQIRRDSWVPQRNVYIGDCELWMDINIHDQ